MSSTDFCSEQQILDAMLAGTAFLDVRAEVEFLQGSLPGAFNLPILNNEERALVGTCYKQNGQEAAIQLGKELVSGDIKKSRIESWKEFCHKNPKAILYCFRGGMRSRFAQEWLCESGVRILRIQGGYKKYRQVLLEEIEQAAQKTHMVLLTGYTGSAKTKLLRSLQTQIPFCDLELFANHKGSAFGTPFDGQPSQANFENVLAVDLMRKKKCTEQLVLEDESVVIGDVHIPNNIYEKMKDAPVVFMQIPFSERAEHIFDEYVTEARMQGHSFADIEKKYLHSLGRITKKLGGVRANEIAMAIKLAFESPNEKSLHIDWIAMLLKYYYDPLYEKAIARKSGRIVFEGNRKECAEYLLNKFGYK